MTNNNSTHDILRKTRVLSDTLRDHKIVYLYFDSIKVGRMEFGVIKTPLQGNRYVLKNYSINPEYSELFKGEDSPIVTLSNYVRTLIV